MGRPVGRPKKEPVLWGSLATSGAVSEEGKRRRQRALVHWGEHPWNWLAGKDPESGEPLIWTSDEKAKEQTERPFPAHFDYIRHYIELLHTQQYVIVDKSRQMFVTTATVLYIDWQCRFVANRRWLLSRHKEDDAIEILDLKVKRVHRRLPEWVQAALPLREKPQKRATYPDSGSVIIAVPENVAESEARGGTASGVFIDEGARQHGFYEIVVASMPMCDKVIAVTTPEIGNPGAEQYKRYLDEGREPA